MAYIDGTRDDRTVLEVLEECVRPASRAEQSVGSGEDNAGDQMHTGPLGLRLLRDIGLTREHQDYSARADGAGTSDRRLHRIADKSR